MGQLRKAICLLAISIAVIECSSKSTHKSEAWPCKTVDDCKIYFNEIEEVDCINSVCNCNGTLCHSPKKSKKARAKSFEAKCSSDEDCVPADSNSICLDRTCNCNYGYKKEEETGKCVKSEETPSSNSSCTANTDCAMSHSICSNSSCICVEGFKLIDEECKRIELGTNCTDDAECGDIKFAKCINEKCSCPNEYYQMDNTCVESKKECTNNEDCVSKMGNKSYCQNNSCHCNDMHWYNKERKTCVPSILPGHECHDHKDCHQPGSTDENSTMECVLGECVCKPSYHLYEGYCVSSGMSIHQALLLPLLMSIVFKCIF